MKRLLLLLLLLALPGRPSAQAPPPLVFTHVTIIDTTGAPPSPGMTVVISGDRITELGKSGTVQTRVSSTCRPGWPPDGTPRVTSA